MRNTMSANNANTRESEQEFLMLLAMLPESERYQVAVEIVDIAEKYGDEAQSG